MARPLRRSLEGVETPQAKRASHRVVPRQETSPEAPIWNNEPPQEIAVPGQDHTRTIDAFLHRLSRRIQNEVLATPAARPAMPIICAGGKRLRSRLMWHSAQATSRDLPETVVDDLERAGTAIELAHLGSLIHDDIVDDAETRRNVTALQQARGLETAARTGTALLHLASALIASLPTSLRNSFAWAVARTCRGQLRELIGLHRQCSPGTRLSIAREKTGAFFELATDIGTQLTDAPVRMRVLLRCFARDLGAAFQIEDDITDLVGSRSRLGRANGADVRDGVMTLPVILAQRTPRVRRELRAFWVNPEPAHLQECLHLIVTHGAVREAALERRALAIRALRVLEHLPVGSGRGALETMARALVTTRSAGVATADIVPVDARRCARLAPFRNLGAITKGRTPSVHGVDAALDRGLRDLHPILSLAAIGVPRLDRDRQKASENPLQQASRAAELRGRIQADQLMAAPPLGITLADCVDVLSFAACTRLSNSVHARFELDVLKILNLRESAFHSAGQNRLDTLEPDYPAACLR